MFLIPLRLFIIPMTSFPLLVVNFLYSPIYTQRLTDSSPPRSLCHVIPSKSSDIQLETTTLRMDASVMIESIVQMWMACQTEKKEKGNFHAKYPQTSCLNQSKPFILAHAAKNLLTTTKLDYKVERSTATNVIPFNHKMPAN